LQSSRLYKYVYSEREREREREYKHDVSGTLSWSKIIYFLTFDLIIKYVYLTLAPCSLQIRWFANINSYFRFYVYSHTFALFVVVLQIYFVQV
jgi:hypothetical protein